VANLGNLGEIDTRTTMLTVVCSRCEYSGRHRHNTLIAHHDAGVRVIVPEPTNASPRRHVAALMGWCDILIHELRELFRGR